MAQPKAQSLVLNSFGANLRRLHAQADLNQAKMAERVNVELHQENLRPALKKALFQWRPGAGFLRRMMRPGKVV